MVTKGKTVLAKTIKGVEEFKKFNIYYANICNLRYKLYIL